MSVRIDLTGQKFSKLSVVKDVGRNGTGSVLWECECECGKKRVTTGDSLKSGKAISCGCYRLNQITDEEMVGKVFNSLTVLSRSDTDSSDSQTFWLCKCECGNTTEVRGGNLKSGNSRTCGCGRGKTHGLSGVPEYNTWNGIKARCLNPNNKAYSYYGGRGISICSDWIDDFQAFYEYVGPRPGPEYSMDRIDSDGDYAPGNVKWSTPMEQWENRKARGMTFGHYQGETRKTAIYPSETTAEALIYCALGLGSEASEVCGKVKKIIRDNGYEVTADLKRKIADEMGDTLWYLSELANTLDIQLETVASNNLSKLASRAERGVLQGSGDER